MENEFVWVVRNNLVTSLLISDLNPPNGLKIGPYRAIALHKFFNLSTLLNSAGLQYALSSGQLKEVEKILPEQAPKNEPNDISELKNQLGNLTNMVADLINKQPEQPAQIIIEKQSVSDDVISKIMEKFDSLGTTSKTKKLSGYNELTPEMAALKARENIQNVKISNFDSIGKKEIGITDSLNDTLSDMSKIDIDLEDI
jgi:hypothetical protein